VPERCLKKWCEEEVKKEKKKKKLRGNSRGKVCVLPALSRSIR
jgi:hypothetical protein